MPFLKLTISLAPFPRATSDGMTCLHAAVSGKNPELVELILSKGVDVNAASEFYQQTALHFAVSSGQKDIVELLLLNGADIEAKRFGGITPLCEAAEDGHAEVVKLLLSKGANTRVTDSNGGTVMHHVRGAESAILLLEAGVPVDAKDDRGQTPLHTLAHGSGDVAAAAVLLDHGANINSRSHGLHTPLHEAAYRGRKEFVELLVTWGADINARDHLAAIPELAGSGLGEERWTATPLSGAIECNQTEIVDFLRRHGAKE